MESFLELVRTRRSIRKFRNEDIPISDIEYFITAATNAPSGCNSQCWRFVAVKDQEAIRQLAGVIRKKVDDLLEIKGAELTEDYLTAKRKMITFFAKAPLVIAVFMTKAKFYDEFFLSALQAHGYDQEGIMNLLGNYDLLSVGAAIQNLLLAVTEKGYGACWMSEPAVAGEEINKVLGIPKEHKFISLIPIGAPAYTLREKKMKDLQEVLSII